MAENKTGRQVRDEHLQRLGLPLGLQRLGLPLGPIYNALYNEVVWLHAKWQQYRILFVESQERLDLLNGTAGFFFSVIQKVLWEDILLHIALLTDRPQSSGKDNLTLLQLIPALQASPIATEIETLVKQAEKHAEFARDLRNRHLAHRDLHLATNDQATPLSEVSRENIEHALGAMRAVLNKMESHFWQSEVLFTRFLAPDDAESLVYYLKVGLDAEKQPR